MAGDHYISIVRISPFGLPDPGRRYVAMGMVKKVYFDGSSHDAGYLALASLNFPESIVGDFETKWAAILDDYRLKWWHTTDAMNLQDGSRRDFLKDPADEWNLAIAEAAMEELSAVISRFWHEHWRDGVQLLSCCVELAAHVAARVRNTLLRSAEAICVHNTAGYLSIPEDGTALLYFDHGEKFLREIDPVWRKDRKKPWIGWPQQIACISQVDARKVLPVQAADLVAWQINLASRSAPVRGATGFNGMGRVHHYYGLAQIEAEYTREIERQRVEGIRTAGRQTWETAELARIEAVERDEGRS